MNDYTQEPEITTHRPKARGVTTLVMPLPLYLAFNY